MFKIDYRSHVPIYDQIVNSIIRLKTLGVLKDGDKLPSVRTLAIQIGVNPNTVQKAYNILETSRVTYSVTGKGSFISGDDSATEAILTAARSDFSEAVAKAKRVGLSIEELIEIANKMYKGETESD